MSEGQLSETLPGTGDNSYLLTPLEILVAL